MNDDSHQNTSSTRETFRLPKHGRCFLCGENSGTGLDLVFYTDKEKVETRVTLSEGQQGPPGHAHGGVLLAILDEAMGASAWVQGYQVLAGRLEVDYKKPVPLYEEIHVVGMPTSKEGRKVFTEGKIILKNGEVATQARGIFIETKNFFSLCNPVQKER